MILILSTPNDFDTKEVIDWLIHKRAVFFRLNDEDLMNGQVEFYYNPKHIDQSYFKQDQCLIYLKDFNIIWFRKFGFLKNYEEEFGSNSDLVKYMYSEFSILRTTILDILNHKKWLCKRTNMPSKLKVLEIAHSCRLKIPDSLVTSSKEKLNLFFHQNKCSMITKSLGEGKNLVYDNFVFPFFTLKMESINQIGDKFSPSFIQKRIEKKYELRIFYIDGNFYSMVIFSQNNPKTIEDFRNYDLENPNRFEPYTLPRNIQVKLNKMMNLLGLNTGSIDMIKATDDNYYFLEINPSGQFGMTAAPCNYPLYELVADYLIKNQNGD